ncbi:hypothetical protein UY3_13846 [Chelonia mydas]|uniref:Uncharacterized protein n=1 Tax=Chelonia mydas TaxID=8469 RepID=M7AUB6_CHEMY|nr:hypothetical protein UY3_13846 [Chelonia mydas]
MEHALTQARQPSSYRTKVLSSSGTEQRGRFEYQSASVPDDWRIANVMPIFEKGSRGYPGNYRPISLTSVPGKQVETIVKNRIT